MDNKFKPNLKNVSIEKKEMIPATLDIISIDGRWGQVTSSGTDNTLIIWLDGQPPTHEIIHLSKYQLIEVIDSPVFMIRNRFKEEEIQRIHWAGEGEQDRTSYLKPQVMVFGCYVKKSI